MAEVDKNALKMVEQFRDKNRMVYDFRRGPDFLSVRIGEDKSEAGEWTIDVRTSNAPDGVIVSGKGPTRKEALMDAGRSWDSTAIIQGLPRFDWDAVAKALTDVRAI
jgi:hypothetical protein